MKSKKVPIYVSGDSVIGRDHSFIWYCIPRNASRALLELLASDERGVRLKEVAGRRNARRHLQKEKVPPFSFAFIRDPYKRIASAWRSKVMRSPNSSNQERFLQENPTIPAGGSLDDFVAWLDDNLDALGGDPHWRRQSEFVCNGTGARCVNFIGRIESLDTDFSEVESVIGRFGSIPNVEGRRFRGPELTFSPRSRAIIERLFARDFELLAEPRFIESPSIEKGATSSMTYRIAVIGLGKIAQDQHLPVIAKDPAFELAAVSSQRGLKAGKAFAFRDPAKLLAETPDLDAVVVCTPPQARHAIARAALEAGKHVMLEKPPTATLAELADLRRVASKNDLVLMTTWHSQYGDGINAARRLLRGKTITRLFIEWKEDVRKWHPGQAWIWKAGGFGVFDPGINALSIVTKIMPEPVFVSAAELFVPANAEAPIAANLVLSVGGRAGDFRAEFDWRPIDHDIWEISIDTADGQKLHLSSGGAKLMLDGELVVDKQPAEYEGIYDHFRRLLANRTSYIDASPLQLVADAFMLGKRTEVAALVE